MAKKRKRVDYDSPLMSIYSPEYQYLMKQNAPENANTFEGGGPMGPTYDREFYNDGLVGTERITSPQIQMQNLVNTTAQNQYNQDIANMKSTGQAISQQQSTQPSTGSNVNWGGVIGTAATATANAIRNGGSAADIVANAMGIPVLAKMWKANTEKGDANIKSAQEAIASVQDNKYIQDANSLQGVGNALKLNMSNKPKMIDTSGFQRMTNWKDFSSGRGSGTWWKNMATAQFQGAASGSVGGPWGALGGATAGLLGSIGGLFGGKTRAKKAMDEYNQRMDSLRAYATAENLRRKTDYELSNQNAIHNGLGQQSIKEMSNFKAYGGNLYPNGGDIDPYYPPSSDPDAVNWLADWYAQRPTQIQNTFGNNNNLSFTQIRPNMNESYYGEDKVPSDRKVNYDLLTYPTEEEYNKNLYKNLIDRAAASSNIFSENMWKGAGGTYSNDGTHFVQNPNFDPHYNDWLMKQWKAGNYVDMDESKSTPETLISGDNYKNTIMYNWKTMNERNDAMPTRIHERTHSMVTDPLLNSIDTGLQNAINNRVKLRKDFNREHYGNNDAYWDDPNEIYSRMNEFRYESGLKGSDNVDQKFLNDNRKLLEEKGLDRYTDESLLKLFNEVAYNNTNNYNNIAAMGGNLYPDGGSIDPYYPESQDPTAVNWLSDWYRQRPEQLKNTFYGSTYDMPNPNMSGEYEELSDIPLDRTINPSSKFFDDSLYRSLIDRAATTSPVYRMDMPSTTLGEYSPLGQNITTEDGFVNYPNAAHTISYNMRDVPAFANPDEDYYDKETLPLRIHENNHSITHGFDSVAKEINNRIIRKDGVERDSYKDNPYEVHSYMMEFRNKAGLNPTDIITKDVLNKYRKELKETNLDRYTDDSLIDLLNNVVDSNDMKRYSNVAAFGGGLDLSPNMMNLWNDKQNIDKQKIMNQQMNFGLGNSFNTKLNMFDFGGYADLKNYADSYKSSIDEAERNRAEFENVYRKDWGKLTPVYAGYTEDDFIRESNNPDNPDMLGLGLSEYNRYKYRKFLNYPNKNVGTAYLHYPADMNEVYNATPDNELPIHKDKDGYWYLKQGIPHPANGYDNIPRDNDNERGIIRNKKGDLRLNGKDVKLYKEALKRIAFDNDFYNFVATNREKEENNDNPINNSNNIVNKNSTNNNSFTIPDLDEIVANYMKEHNIGNNDNIINNSNNITAKKTPSKESTEGQREYYNKKRQSYSEFNKDMGFNTKDDVKRFQEAYNREHEDKLKVDGLTGDKTIKAYQRWVNELNKDNKDKEALKIDGFYGKKSKKLANSDIINRMLNTNEFDYTQIENANIDTDADGYSEDYSTQQVQEPNVYEQEKYEDLYGNDYDNIDQNKQNYYNNYPYAYGGNLNIFDYGGSMNGMNLPTDMQYYENGGTHEQNPNGGIQVGQDQQGNPNLVEEGEFRYGDYIFSDRIPVDYNILSDFNVEKGKSNRNTKNNPTYAQLAKKTADKYKDLNDKISKDSLNKQLDRLQQSQEAQKFKEQQDQQYAYYTNALKSPTQGNPMYGNMKYNGMGNANQGVNAGIDDGMGAIDNSGLSNVNRSGNAMMAAYGGNIYKDGDEMSFVIPKSLLGSIRTPSLSYSTPTLNNFSSFVDVNSDKNINDNQSYEYLNNYFTPNQVADLRESYGLSRAGGIDTPFVKNVQKMIGARRNGIFDDKSQLALNKFANYPTEDVVNPNNSQYGTTQGSTKVATKTPTQVPLKDENTNDENIKTINGNESAVNNTMAVSGKGPQEPVEVDYNLGRPAAGISDYTDPTVPMYNDNGYWANLAKGIMPNLMNWSGKANWEFDPDWRPEVKLEALGKTAYANRIADHLGDYIAPNLMDIERLNNQAMAQTAAQQRGIQNISGGNRGFVGAQGAATDYNGQMGIGNNYVTANQYNTDQLFKSAEFNKATNQFNATANNEAWRDNLDSWLQGKNMEINALVQANQARNQKAEYKDKVDRDAALNRSSDLGAMADNMINTVVDNTLYNRGLNNINTKLNNRYYLDKDKGWTYKGDTGIGRQINEYAKGVRLTSDDYTQINNILKEDPHNIAGIEGIIDARRAEQDKQDIKDFNDKHNSIIADFDNYSSLLDDALFGDIYKNENRLAFNKARDEYEEVINNKKSTSSQKEQAYNNFRNKVNQMKDKYALYKGMVYSQRNKSFDLTPEEYATLYEKRQKDNKSAYGGKINTRKHREHSYMDI